MNTTKLYREITCCRSCKSKRLTDILSLGNLAVSDFVDNPAVETGIIAPLDLILCNPKMGGCGLLQLRHTVSAEAMYRNYWYKSGINQTMLDELADISANAARVANLEAGDFVIDIGANDGTLLRSYNIPHLNTVGFEPARNLYEYGEKGTTKIFVDFFNHAAWFKVFGDVKVKVITAIGMFYDLDDPNSFLEDVWKCLDDEGVLIIQMMYMPFAIERNAFDGICHEHLEYYTIISLENLLSNNGFEIFDIQLREEINEGSARFFICKNNAKIAGPGNDSGKKRVEACRDAERKLGLTELGTYEAMATRIELGRQTTINFLKQEKARGKKIHGYAASTKGNTTLQYYKITTDLIDAIADRNFTKYGKYTVGTGIPIISEEDSRKQMPDYYFVLAWHFLPEFLKRESGHMKPGGKFIVSMPEFKLIDVN
jgi:2-polyprenyl-3-methyl-5-hydroxy-6-metoxy-1,4-benzoquinol methylase